MLKQNPACLSPLPFPDLRSPKTGTLCSAGLAPPLQEEDAEGRIEEMESESNRKPRASLPGLALGQEGVGSATSH